MRQFLFSNLKQRYSFLNIFVWVLALSILWLIFIYNLVLHSDDGESNEFLKEYPPHLLLGTLATTVFFYLSLNYFHNLLKQKRNWTAFVLPSFICFGVIELYNIIIDLIGPRAEKDDFSSSFSERMAEDLFIIIPFMFFTFLIPYVNELRDQKKTHRILEKQKLQLEVEKTQAELNFLKSQVNPHFLHNTLNSFYARSLPLSQELSDGILTLSEIMRYSLEETHTQDGKVQLKNEIEHVRNVIKLNQFRFRNNLPINLQVKGEINGYVMIPFILITLVENIFKHGDLSDNDNEIDIIIEIDNGSLSYNSSNKKKNGPIELSTGIGLDNIKKRLDIAYGKGYRLDIKEGQNWYTTVLIIDNL